MSIFDKAVDFAKNAAAVTGEAAVSAAEKTQTAIEITKINAKIREEKDAVERCKANIGSYFLQKLEAGELEDLYLIEAGKEVQAREQKIRDYEAEIAGLKEK